MIDRRRPTNFDNKFVLPIVAGLDAETHCAGETLRVCRRSVSAERAFASSTIEQCPGSGTDVGGRTCADTEFRLTLRPWHQRGRRARIVDGTLSSLIT